MVEPRLNGRPPCPRPRRAERSRARRLSAGACGLLLATALLSGCAPSAAKHASLAGYDQYVGKPGEPAYLRLLEHWTGELRLYDRGTTTLLLHATFKHRDFRRGWSHEYARRFILPAEDRALLTEREEADASRFHEVLVAAWANDTKRGHFEGDDAPWALRLVGQSGQSVAPLVVTLIKRPTTELLSLNPHIDGHDRLFLVKFPVLAPDGSPLIAPRDGRVLLQVAGVLHRGEIEWALPPPRPDAAPPVVDADEHDDEPVSGGPASEPIAEPSPEG